MILALGVILLNFQTCVCRPHNRWQLIFLIFDFDTKIYDKVYIATIICHLCPFQYLQYQQILSISSVS